MIEDESGSLKHYCTLTLSRGKIMYSSVSKFALDNLFILEALVDNEGTHAKIRVEAWADRHS
jgi:hypothetical protein